jgi:uncharacterized protein with von Willebrand factor type A (vWA) domain
VKDALLGFLRAARQAGVEVSPAESIDAFRAIELTGFDDRDAVRGALALVLGKTAEDERRVELVFDRYFGGEGAAFAPTVAERDETIEQIDLDIAAFQADLADSELARMLLADDRARLVRDLYLAGRAEGIESARYFTQINAIARRMLERLGLGELDAAIARLQARGDARAAQIADFLQQRRSAVSQLARDLVERRFAASSGGGAEMRRDEFLRDARLANVDRRDIERMRALVREVARRFATRYGRVRKRKERGRLDTRKTTRGAIATGGVPFRVHWKTRTLEKPRLLLLCDVSGSVSTLASFFLLFIHELREAIADVRAFAFSGRALDITDVLARGSIEDLGQHVMREIGYQSSDYGRAFGEIEAGGAFEAVDRKTTVVILGDGRTNYGDPRIDLVQRLHERAKRVVWLNPEDRGSWGTDDSEMLRYARHVHVAQTCNRLRHLERFVETLLAAQ